MRAPRAALLGAALAAVVVLRLPAAWASGNALNHVSGTWMALADDLAHGTLYRPLHDPALGYGGTRLFPLAFALHAALLRAGAPLLPAGLLLSLAAGGLAVAGAARFLRRAGHGPLAAAGLAPLILAGFAGQHALAAVRGDLLAAALALWGLGALLPREGGRPGARGGGWGVAAALFALAFAAKPTTLAAAGAGIAFLLLRGELRRALALAAGVAAGSAAAVLATELLSGGRFLALMGALGAGGAGPGNLLRAPVRLLDLLWRADPQGLAVLAAGIAAALFTYREGGARAGPAGPRALAGLWLAASGASTLVILSSPGTGVNHLVDVEAAAALLACACASGPPGRGVRVSRGAAAATALAGIAAAALIWRGDLQQSRRAALRAALAAAAGAGGPLLSEDPLVPLAAGERPHVLDAWMLRLAAARDPALAAPLLSGLRRGAYRAVVLLHDVQAPGAEEWFSVQLGAAALAELRGRWRKTFTAGPYHVYRYDPPVHAPEPASGPEDHLGLSRVPAVLPTGAGTGTVCGSGARPEWKPATPEREPGSPERESYEGPPDRRGTGRSLGGRGNGG